MDSEPFSTGNPELGNQPLLEENDKQDSDPDLGNECLFPSGKLAAITRKQNQIKPFLHCNSDEAINSVTKLFKEYKTKIETFIHACEAECAREDVSKYSKSCLSEWQNLKSKDMSKFKLEVNDWLSSIRQSSDLGNWLRSVPEPSVHQIKSSNDEFDKESKSSRASSRAKTLAKMKLLDERAKLEEEKRMFDLKIQEMEEERIKEARLKKFEEEETAAKYELKLKRLELKEQLMDNDSEEDIGEWIANYKIEDPIEYQNNNLNKRVTLNTSNAPNVQSSTSVIKSPIEEALIKQNEISLLLMKNQEKAFLPRVEPEVFSGSDPTEFRSFMLSFNRTINDKALSDIDKYYYLLTFTSGHAQDLVKSCNENDPSLSFSSAIKTLNERYGNEFKIAEAYMQKLDKWTNIKSEDGKAMEEFSIFLTGCMKLMKDMSTLNHLNSPMYIQKIVMLLPYDLRRRWREHACSLMENSKEIKFESLVKFIDRQTKVINLPLYGAIKDETSGNNQKHFSKDKKKSFHTSVTPSNEHGRECLCCTKTNHKLDSCFFFGKKPHDEKIDFLKKKRLCFSCLSEGHSSKYCKQRLKCKQPSCGRMHPTCLHNDNYKHKGESKSTDLPGKNPTDELVNKESKKEEHNSFNEDEHKSCVVNKSNAHFRKVSPAVPVKIKVNGERNYIYTYMGMDPYSSHCYVSESLMKKVKITGKEETICMTTMENVGSMVKTKVIENLQIFSLDGQETEKIPFLYAKQTWPFDETDSPKPDDIEDFPQFKTIPFNFINASIDILVGVNVPSIVKPLDIISSSDTNGPYVTLHKFGWAINGPIFGTDHKKSSSFFVKSKGLEDIEMKLEKMHGRDFEDNHGNVITPSINDFKFMEKVQNSVKQREDGHLEICLPFVDDNLSFPSNFNQVYNRCLSLKRKFLQNENYWQQYSAFMNNMLEAGFAEKIPDEDVYCSSDRRWYLAHHGVFHPRKGKLRVVFDCSLKYKGKSLNDHLLQGPDMVNNLLGVLLRFRQRKIAFMSDIEKMYYQVKVPKRDADCLRFFWFPNNDVSKNPEQYRLLVHVFGAKSSPSCANFALKQSALSEGISEEARDTISRSFYVDDALKSVDDENTAIKLISEVCSCISKYRFNLTEFVSNSRSVLKSIPAEKLSKSIKILNLTRDNDLPSERALGVVWNVQDDSLGFRLQFEDQPITRRGILSVTFNLYDPFGIASPVVIVARRIFQQCCQLKLPWDDPLPDALQKQWLKWLNDAPLLNAYEVPRCYAPFVADAKNIQLHIFCDGSLTAYGACAYYRIIDHQDNIYSMLIMAKARMTPINNSTLKTVPRIELNSAKLAIIIQQILHKEMDLKHDQEFFWSDSTTVLSYIKSESGRFQRFVANRVGFIRSHSSPDQWNFVNGCMNPADLISRGMTVKDFLENTVWTRGPQFFQHLEDTWPKSPAVQSVLINDPEVKKDFKTAAIKVEENATETLITSCSNWFKLRRRIALFIRLKNNLKRKVWKHEEIAISELKAAEIAIFKYVQGTQFPETIKFLSTKKPDESLKKGNALKKLIPFIDSDGIMRVGGRLNRSPVSFDVKHPIILHKSSIVSRLLVENSHILGGHMGREYVLANLRKRFWIVSGNSLVRELLRKCIICRKQLGTPSDQLMADLPKDRVTGGQKVFSDTGIDFFGPFSVSRGRTQVKRYGVIFTCLASRAMHLEVSCSLDTDSFLCSLRRFFSRRGSVTTIRSDNGTNFVSGNRELKEAIKAWNNQKIDNWFKQRDITWKFQPPAAPHFSGVWEREIRTVKRVLNSLIKEQPMRMTDELLNTLFCEVENILNNRPITVASSDPQDLEALSPNHLLLLSYGTTFPPGLFTKDDLYAKQRWRQVQYLSNLFWVRWRNEYLPLLQERQKWTQIRRQHEVGDLVLVVDQLLPRNLWCMGRIIEIIKDSNGNVRIAKVRVSKHKSGKELKFGPAVLERPIAKLILLRANEELFC